MNLWICGEEIDGYEPGHWVAYWSWGSDEAVQHWRDTYEHRCDLDIAQCRVSLAECQHTPDRDEPHEEGRPDVLRSLGWGFEDDRKCDTCGLHEFGVATVCCECGTCDECLGKPVCAYCGHCPECGCECDEEENTDGDD